MKAHVRLSWILVLASCGSSGGGTHVDAFMGNVPPMITLTGTANQQSTSGTTPLAGVTLAAYRVTDDNTVVATATSGADGKYTMTVTTNSQPLDGYVKATKTGFVDTYLYPPQVLIADFSGADANMLDTTTFGLLRGFGGGTAGKGMIAMEVEDAASNPVMGATVMTSPASAAYKYSDSNGLPTSTSGTATDGQAFAFDAPPTGEITLTAAKSGVTFKSHKLKARADVFTTTLVTE
jgi:hypothetical protein